MFDFVNTPSANASHMDEPNIRARSTVLSSIYREVHATKAGHTVHSSTMHGRQKVEIIQIPFHIHTMEYSWTIKKEQSTNTCNNMDEPQRHYAKQKNTDTENCILYEYIYMTFLEKEDYRDRKYRGGQK